MFTGSALHGLGHVVLVCSPGCCHRFPLAVWGWPARRAGLAGTRAGSTLLAPGHFCPGVVPGLLSFFALAALGGSDGQA